MIEEGIKVDTDTTRTLDASAFDAAFAADDSETPAEATADVATETVVGAGGTGSPAGDPEPQPAPVEASTALPEGYKLDSLGRVHGPDGRVVSKDEAAKLLGSTPVAPTPEVPAASEAAPKATAPFQYRSFGETKAVEGYAQHEDGSVTVSADKVSELRHLHSLAETFTQQSGYIDQVKAENARLKQEAEQRVKVGSEESERAKVLVNAYSQLLQEPDDEKFVLAAFQLRQNFPVLLANAKASYYERLAKEGRPATPAQDPPEKAQQDTKQDALPARESAIAATQDHIERARLDHKYRDVTPADWKQFSDRMARTPYAYIRQAVEADAKYGARVGEVVFDLDALSADVEEYAGQIRKMRETAKANAFNAKVNGSQPASPTKPKPRALAAAPSNTAGPTFDQAWNDDD